MCIQFVMPRTRIAIYGATGHMGQALVRAALKAADLQIVAALVRVDSDLNGDPLADVFGHAAPDLAFSAALDPYADAQVLIDFTGARAFDSALALALSHKLAFLSGTTGLAEAQQEQLRQASASIPILWSANFSVGVALLKRLTALAAAALGPTFDAEILEIHHRFKQDAPSGTAIALGRAIAEARGHRFEERARYSREGQVGQRGAGEIGFAVQRAADVVGEHSVLFAAPGERIELVHRAGSRSVFATGALRAAKWLAGKPPGRYDVVDVLDIPD